MLPEILSSELNEIHFGDTVKALGDVSKGDYKVGGYLVRFGSKTDADLSGEYFTADTDFGLPMLEKNVPVPVMYQHGFDVLLGKAIIGKGVITKDDIGLWFEAQLELNDQYIAKLKERGVINAKTNAKFILNSLYKAVSDEKLGWSSGVKFAEREPDVNGANFIKTWHVVEGTMTPTPMEYRNTIQSIKSFKSLLELDDAETSKTETAFDEANETQKAGATMSRKNLSELKNLCDRQASLSKDMKLFHGKMTGSSSSKSIFETDDEKAIDLYNYLLSESGWSYAGQIRQIGDLLYTNPDFLNIEAIAKGLEDLAQEVRDAYVQWQETNSAAAKSQTAKEEETDSGSVEKGATEPSTTENATTDDGEKFIVNAADLDTELFEAVSFNN